MARFAASIDFFILYIDDWYNQKCLVSSTDMSDGITSTH